MFFLKKETAALLLQTCSPGRRIHRPDVGRAAAVKVPANPIHSTGPIRRRQQTHVIGNGLPVLPAFFFPSLPPFLSSVSSARPAVPASYKATTHPPGRLWSASPHPTPPPLRSPPFPPSPASCCRLPPSQTRRQQTGFRLLGSETSRARYAPPLPCSSLPLLPSRLISAAFFFL